MVRVLNESWCVGFVEYRGFCYWFLALIHFSTIKVFSSVFPGKLLLYFVLYGTAIVNRHSLDSFSFLLFHIRLEISNSSPMQHHIIVVWLHAIGRVCQHSRCRESWPCQHVWRTSLSNHNELGCRCLACACFLFQIILAIFILSMTKYHPLPS